MKKTILYACLAVFIYLTGIMVINQLLPNSGWRHVLVGMWFLPFYFYYMKVNQKPSEK